MSRRGPGSQEARFSKVQAFGAVLCIVSGGAGILLQTEGRKLVTLSQPAPVTEASGGVTFTTVQTTLHLQWLLPVAIVFAIGTLCMLLGDSRSVDPSGGRRSD